MAKVQIAARVEEEDYRLARQILEQLGLNYPQALNIFNKAIIRYRGIPFSLQLEPTEETVKAFLEAEKGEVEQFDSVEEWEQSLMKEER